MRLSRSLCTLRVASIDGFEWGAVFVHVSPSIAIYYCYLDTERRSFKIQHPLGSRETVECIKYVLHRGVVIFIIPCRRPARDKNVKGRNFILYYVFLYRYNKLVRICMFIWVKRQRKVLSKGSEFRLHCVPHSKRQETRSE